LEACYKHSTAILQTEIEYFHKNDQPQLVQHATRLLRKNIPQTPLLRLGAGQGLLSITTDLWLRQRDPEVYEIFRQAVSTMRKWKNTLENNFPKTRRVIHHGREPVEMLGWTQLIPPADKQVQGNIEFNFAPARVANVSPPTTSKPVLRSQSAQHSPKGRQRGRVKFFNDSKGFGFIKPESGNDIFVHITEVQGGVLAENDSVSFEIGPGRKGPQAINVKRE
jgi:CspA family cold shock protein